MEVPEYTPIRFDVSDVAGFKSHLDEHGCEHHHQLSDALPVGSIAIISASRLTIVNTTRRAHVVGGNWW